MAWSIAVASGHYRRIALAYMLVPFKALKAMPAGGGPVQDDVITDRNRRHVFSCFINDTCAFMPHYQGLPPLQGVIIGVAEGGRFHLHNYLIGLWLLHFNLIYNKVPPAVSQCCSATQCHKLIYLYMPVG